MTVNDIGGQGDPSGGGWEDADDIDTTDVDDTTEDPDDGDPAAEVDDDQDGGDEDADQNGRPGKAASLRRRAQAAEAERDQLRQQLDATWQDIVDDVARRERLNSRLLRAGERDIAEFLQENGLLDRDAIKEALTTLARDLGVHRGIRADPTQGHKGIAARGSGVGDTIAKALGRKQTG